MKVIKCDVVIPYCENNTRWLKESIDSILNQTGADCTIHLIADGCDNFDFEHKNIKHYKNEESVGPYISTNRIANNFKTPYIAIQDSDDISLPHRIRYSVWKLQQNKAEMFGASMISFTSWENAVPWSKKFVYDKPRLVSTMNSTWPTSPHCIIINGSRLMKTDMFHRMNGFAPVPMTGDNEFTTRCYLAGVKITIHDEIVAMRRMHPDSLSRNNKTGMGTPIRDYWHKRIIDSFDEMKPGFDPKKFGGINAY